MKKVSGFLQNITINLQRTVKRIAPVANFMRILFWIFALFIGTGFLFLLFSALQPSALLGEPLARYPDFPEYDFKEDFSSILTSGNNKILSREVKINLSASEMKGEFILVIPSNDPVARVITGGIPEERILSFIELVFGTMKEPTAEEDVLIFADPASYEVTWTIDASEGTLRFVATAREPITNGFVYVYYTPAAIVPPPERDKFLVLFNGFRVVSISPTPPAADLSSTRLLVEKKNETLSKTSLSFRLINPDDLADPAEKPGSMQRQYIIQDLDDWLENIPFISAILFAILEAVPLLLFLRIRRRYSGTEWTNALTVIGFAVSAFILYHFVLYFLSGSINLFAKSTTISSASHLVVEKIGTYFRASMVGEFGTYYRLLSSTPLTTSPRYFGIIVLSIWIPLIFFNWWGGSAPGPNERYPIINSILFYAIFGLIAISCAWLIDQYMLAHHERYAGIPLNDILSFDFSRIFLVIVLVIIAGSLWVQYRDNLRRNRISWLSWLDKVILFLLGWVLWIPLIVALIVTLSIYSIERYQGGLAAVSSFAAHVVSITPVWMWIILLVSVTGLFLLMAMRYVTRGYIADNLRFRAARYSMGLLILFAFLKENKLDLARYDWPETIEWTILLVIFGTLLAASLGFLVLGAVARLSHGAISSTSHRKWVWAGAFALALPVNVLISSWENQTTAFSNLFNLAYTLDNLLVFLWLGGVVVYLREQGSTNTRISAVTYEVGVLAAAAILFSVTARWFFIPITFIVGWGCLRYLIRVEHDWEQLNNIYQYVNANRRILLEKIINLNAVQATFDDFRKKAIERFSKNSRTTFAQLDNTIVARRVKLDKQIAGTRVNNTHPKDLVFAFGPYDSSWKNGVHGARWAIIFAIPWLVLYLREFLTITEVPYTYSSLNYLVNILSILFYWVGMGFIFGYFFPYIRGSSGVSKGFNLFIVIFAASLPIAVLYRESSADWRALLLWGLQVFIQYMLLGLVAFDYWTLRRDGRGWQTLFDVHGIAKLGISVSTILAAIGATLITLLTSQATSLIGVSLKFIFPELPADFLPK